MILFILKLLKYVYLVIHFLMKFYKHKKLITKQIVLIEFCDTILHKLYWKLIRINCIIDIFKTLNYLKYVLL